MRSVRSGAVAVAALAALVGTAALLIAGPLDPPAGPVTSTHKTLTEVEPRTAISATNTPGDAGSLFRINQPGSYYLTGNVTGVTGKSGILIATSNVTVDLNGFALIGTAAGTIDGVSSLAVGVVNVVVRNGAVDGWDGDGIDFSNPSASVRVERVTVRSVAGTGIKTDLNSTIADCATYACANGIDAGEDALVDRCQVRGNQVASSFGIRVAPRSVVRACTASEFDIGILATSNTSVSHCAASGNASTGIVALNGGSVSDCVASENGIGFSAAFGCTFENCVAEGNASTGFVRGFPEGDAIFSKCVASDNGGVGFSVQGALVECLALRNAGAGIIIFGDGIEPIGQSSATRCRADRNGGHGIDAREGSTVVDCTASSNDGSGIFTEASVVVERCTTFKNAGAGISCDSFCRIEENASRENGAGLGNVGAGILVRNSASRTVVMNNTCLNNDFGIRVDGPNNLIKGNTCSLNPSNFEIVSGNRVSVILVLPTLGAISGNAGGSAVTSPEANYAY